MEPCVTLERCMIKRIADCTQNNNHVDALITIGKALEDVYFEFDMMRKRFLVATYVVRLQYLKEKRDRNGSLTYNDSLERATIYQELMKMSEATYLNHKEVYMAT